MTERMPHRGVGPQRAIAHYAQATYREAILEAAERLFVRVGYHETKISDLAAEAGIAVGTLYKHFESKEQVFASLSARDRQHLFEILEQTGERVDDPVSRLSNIVGRVFGYVEGRGALFAIYAELGAAGEVQAQPFGGRSTERACDRLLGVFESVFEEAAKAGLVRSDMAVSLLSATLAGAMHAVLLAWVRADRKYSLSEQTLPLVHLFLQGALKQ